MPRYLLLDPTTFFTGIYIDPNPIWSGTENEVARIRHLDNLHRYGYQLIFYTQGTQKKLEHFIKSLKNTCRILQMAFPSVRLMALYDASLPSKIIINESHDIPMITLGGQAPDGTLLLRRAIERNLSISDTDRKDHIILGASGSTLDGAQQEGYQVVPFGNAENKISLLLPIVFKDVPDYFIAGLDGNTLTIFMKGIDKDISALKIFLERFPYVKRLTLVDLKLTDDHVKALLDEISIQELDLASNIAISDKSVCALRDAKRLVHLDVSGTSITEAGLLILLESETLKSLDIDSSQAGDNFLDAFKINREPLDDVAIVVSPAIGSSGFRPQGLEAFQAFAARVTLKRKPPPPQMRLTRLGINKRFVGGDSPFNIAADKIALLLKHPQLACLEINQLIHATEALALLNGDTAPLQFLSMRFCGLLQDRHFETLSRLAIPMLDLSFNFLSEKNCLLLAGMHHVTALNLRRVNDVMNEINWNLVANKFMQHPHLTSLILTIDNKTYYFGEKMPHDDDGFTRYPNDLTEDSPYYKLHLHLLANAKKRRLCCATSHMAFVTRMYHAARTSEIKSSVFDIATILMPLIGIESDKALLEKSEVLSTRKTPYEDRAVFENYKKHLKDAFEPLKFALDNTVRQNKHKTYEVTNIALIDLKIHLMGYLDELDLIRRLPIQARLQKDNANCLESINVALGKMNEHNSWWYRSNPLFRKTLGVFVLILFIPFIAMALFAPRGYWCTFFEETPEKNILTLLKAFQSHLYFAMPFIESKEPESASTMLSLD